MKLVLFFTFLGPFVGTILFFVLSMLSASYFSDVLNRLTLKENLSLFPVFLSMGYFYASVPSFFVGITAAFLQFNNPWVNYSVLIVLSMIVCGTYYFTTRDWDFIFPSALGVVTTMILGYFIFLHSHLYKANSI